MPPFFSVIIPTHGRPQQLAVCLQALAHQNYPRDRFEVIVVDDGSETPPHEVVAKFENQLGLKLIQQKNAGPAAARNNGAKHAKGEYWAFTDDDCAPHSDWLRVFATQLAETPNCMIGGRTINALSRNLYSIASQQLVAFLYEYYNTQLGQAHFLTSNNVAVPAEQFEKLNGFDSSFPRAAGEDRDFCQRWRYHGFQIVYAPQAMVFHHHAMTWRAFWRQHFNYGRGAFHFHQKRAQRERGPIKVEPLSFYLGILRYPFSQQRSLSSLPLSVLLSVSQIANALGFFWEKYSHTRKPSTFRKTILAPSNS